MRGCRRGANELFAWLLLVALAFGLPQPLPAATATGPLGATFICSVHDDGTSDSDGAVDSHACCWWMGCQAAVAVLPAGLPIAVPVPAGGRTVSADATAPAVTVRWLGARPRAPPV